MCKEKWIIFSYKVLRKFWKDVKWMCMQWPYFLLWMNDEAQVVILHEERSVNWINCISNLNEILKWMMTNKFEVHGRCFNGNFLLTNINVNENNLWGPFTVFLTSSISRTYWIYTNNNVPIPILSLFLIAFLI